MSTVVETANYDATVYSLDTTDPALGGPTGPLNKAAQNLANRTAFLLGQVKNLTAGQATYALDTGTAVAYAAAFSPATPALLDGMVRKFKAGHQNTGTATFAPDGLAALPIYGNNHQPLKGGEIAAIGDVEMQLNLSLNGGAGAWVILFAGGAAQQMGAGSYAVTPANDDSSAALATTAYVLGQVSATAPAMDGVANAGTSKRFARSDHAHPTDTSRVNKAGDTMSGLLKIGLTNSVAPTSGSHLQLDNTNAVSGENVIGFTFNGVTKASVRVDSGGDLVLSSAANNFYFNADLGAANFNFLGPTGGAFLAVAGQNVAFPGFVSASGSVSAPYVFGDGASNPGVGTSGGYLWNGGGAGGFLGLVNSTGPANGHLHELFLSGGTLQGRFTSDAYNTSATWLNVTGTSAAVTSITFGVRPGWAGSTPWDSNNFNPANYLPVAGGTMSGALAVAVGAPAAANQTFWNLRSSLAAGGTSAAGQGAGLALDSMTNQGVETVAGVSAGLGSGGSGVGDYSGGISFWTKPATKTVLSLAGGFDPNGNFNSVGAGAFGGKVTVAAGGLTVTAGGAAVTGGTTTDSLAVTGAATATSPASNDNSTRLATTAWVRAALTGTLGASGYQRFPDGLIMQWGQTAFGSGTANSAVVQTLPLAWPNGYLGGVASDTGNTGYACSVGANSLTAINVYTAQYNCSGGSIVAHSNVSSAWVVFGN